MSCLSLSLSTEIEDCRASDTLYYIMPLLTSESICLQRDEDRSMAEETAKALPLTTATSVNESALDASLTLGPNNTAEGTPLVEITNSSAHS